MVKAELLNIYIWSHCSCLTEYFAHELYKIRVQLVSQNKLFQSNRNVFTLRNKKKNDIIFLARPLERERKKCSFLQRNCDRLLQLCICIPWTLCNTFSLSLSLSLSLTPSRSADEEKTFSTKKLSERMENKNCFNKLDTSLYLRHETRVKAFQSYIGTLATTVSSSTHDKKLPEMPSVGHGEDAVVSATIRSGLQDTSRLLG